MLAVVVTLMLATTDPADEPPMAVVQHDPLLAVDASLAVQTLALGSSALDIRGVLALRDDLAFELRQAASLRLAPGDGDELYPIARLSNTLVAAHWQPLLLAHDAHELRSLVDAGFVAPLGSFGRTAGGALGALGLSWRYRRSGGAWSAGLRAVLDGVWHPLTWPLRVDGDFAGLASSGLSSLAVGDSCTAQGVASLFRFACVPSDLSRVGGAVALEARILDDALAFEVSLARTESFLRGSGAPFALPNVVGMNALALRASWRPIEPVTIGAGSWWSQAPFAIDDGEVVAPSPFVLADLRATTWFVDVTYGAQMTPPLYAP